MIMPVGSDPDYPAKRSVADGVALESGTLVHFPLDGAAGVEQQFDAELTERDFIDADLVIADLALERPSCYYELGFAQALGRPTQIIAPEGTHIHQAGGRESAMYYEDLLAYHAVLSRIFTTSELRPPAKDGTK